MSSNVHIDVTFYGGTAIEHAAAEVIRLADLLQVNIHADFNGVLLMGRPGDSATRLVESWRVELERGGLHPIATGAL